ncbi:hypothetical protein ETD86_02320 [Nonomuraea turkmeniaca]|uniref:Uncharacterized protein n=1 Tax=Nonomuraea turkmeniaca TaxID=103838 RepID=A0A5S4FWD4_9ACTN|nr:hypothetical protein [Nonomuraea turkmeniaca]TMR24973.1 hypothetical protein ETD86_02320 [Nonomuraea turkmeniaca]
MTETWRHWWLGVLAGAAPVRAVPAHASAGAGAEQPRRPAAGRRWPADLEPRLRGLPRMVPDRADLPSGGRPA